MPQSGRLPVVFDKSYVMYGGIDAEVFKRCEVQFLKILWVWLHDHLKLIVVLVAIGILAVPSISGPTAGLYVSTGPAFGPNRS